MSSSLTEAIDGALHGDRRAMGRAAAARFSLSRMVEGYLAMYANPAAAERG
jgi:hypothetical protein